MKKSLLVVMFSILACSVFAQNSNCRVLMPEISGTYSGDCKNGLANGRGIAQGRDTYEGLFVKGLPSGEGKYKWSDGTFYEGQWKKGLREGKGKMVYQDSVVSGFWKGGKYQGEKPKQPYAITRMRNVARYSVTKTLETNNAFKLKLLLGGSDNSQVEDFSMAYNSGAEYRNIGIYGLQSTLVPLDVIVRYITWNQLHTVQYEVLFEISIYEEGTWSVVLTNM